MSFNFNKIFFILILLYIKFRTIKLNIIEKIFLFLINYLNENILKRLYKIKKICGEDIRYTYFNNDNIYIVNFNGSQNYKLLWKIKYIGFNFSELGNELSGTEFIIKKHEEYKFTLIIHSNGSKCYYIYGLLNGLQQRTEDYEIWFGQIPFETDFIY